MRAKFKRDTYFPAWKKNISGQGGDGMNWLHKEALNMTFAYKESKCIYVKISDFQTVHHETGDFPRISENDVQKIFTKSHRAIERLKTAELNK